ncbi:O-antigen ligase family protein [Enterobacteriaceae bacterium ESL0689]|nr:O-antigen ligase family protein [Enterobacteriaceae bacterium ESL0689]
MTLIYAIANRKSLSFKSEEIILALTFFLLGASQLIWSYRFPADPEQVYMADIGYPRSGTYLIIGALVMLFLPPLLRKIPVQHKVIIGYAMVIGFLFLTLYALHYHFFISAGRLRIKNSATLSAYLYTMYSLLTLYTLFCLKIKYRRYIIGGVILASLWIIILTETRSALLLYPAILCCCLLSHYRRLKKEVLGICFISLLAGIVIIRSTFPALEGRLTETVSEIADYQHDNNTSLGSRLSMWHTGIEEIIMHPGGVSTQQRVDIISQLMHEKEKGNPEGLRNIVYHLHNDLIDTISLQGVVGGIVLLTLYIAMIIYIQRKAVVKAATALIAAPVILFGLSDTLFIHDRFIIMFISILAIFTALSSAAKQPH